MAFLAHDIWFSTLALAAAGITAVFWLFCGGVRLRRTPLDGWLALFLLTAVSGWWAATNSAWAAAKLGILLAAALGYYLAAGLSRPRLWLAMGVLSGATAVVAAYFLLVHDWQNWPTDVALLTRAGLRWMGIRPFADLPAVHPNKVGGVLAAFLPLMVVTAGYAVRQRRWPGAAVVGMAAALSLLALLMSSSRGAWLALLGGVAVSGVVGVLAGRGVKRPLLLLGVGTAVLLLGASLLTSAGQLAGGDLSRTLLARQTLHLIADYPFTGGGLVSFGPLYSQYVRVIPFFFFSYAHNLYLDVWLEQGPLALLSFLGLMGGALALLLRPATAHEEDGLPLLRLGALAGMLTLLLHGWVDDALYGAWGAPQLLLFAGLAVALSPQAEGAGGTTSWRRWLFVGASVVGVGTAVIFHRPLLSAWYANWGAVQMARVELAGWPTGHWDDGALARQVDTTPFLRALTWNEANGVALYRLGLVALGRREFETAVNYLQAAHLLRPDHRGVMKSLGYGYVWMGEYDQASSLLQQIPEARSELETYGWWWGQQGQRELALHAETMASRLR